MRKYAAFNKKREKRDNLIAMKSPWFLLCVIANDAHDHEEPHVLSRYCRNQKGHYYLIEAAGEMVSYSNSHPKSMWLIIF